MSSHAGGEVPGLAAGRLWAASHFPYLASGLFGAQVLAKPGIATVAVDEGWRLHADPELTAAWTPAQLGSVLVHHVSHLLRAHGERAVAAGIIPDDARTWIRGADAEINDDLVPAGLELPGHPVLPGHLGADEGLLMGNHASLATELKSRTAGRGADMVIEAIGHPEAWELATQLVRRGGTINFFGGCPSGTKVGLDTGLLHYSEITCKASFHHTPAHIRKALDIVGNGDISAKDFVNREEPLTNLLEVMRHLMSHNGHLKTAIVP